MFPDQYQSDIASIQGRIDCLSKILPTRDAALNVHEDGTSAEVTAEVVEQATGVGSGIRPPIADVNSARRNRHSPSPRRFRGQDRTFDRLVQLQIVLSASKR